MIYHTQKALQYIYNHLVIIQIMYSDDWQAPDHYDRYVYQSLMMEAVLYVISRLIG